MAGRKYNKGIIFLNGDPPGAGLLSAAAAEEDALTVCADGAYSYLAGVMLPKVILGDFDSFKGGVPDGCEVVRYGAEKDYTDGHLAVEYLIDRGIKNIDIYGYSGGASDHVYANFSLLALAKSLGGRARLIDERRIVTLEEGEIKLNGVRGLIISLVPFSGNVHIIITKGLKYPMRSVGLGRVHILGISNLAVDDEVSVAFEGELLVFVQNSPEV